MKIDRQNPAEKTGVQAPLIRVLGVIRGEFLCCDPASNFTRRRGVRRRKSGRAVLYHRRPCRGSSCRDSFPFRQHLQCPGGIADGLSSKPTCKGRRGGHPCGEGSWGPDMRHLIRKHFLDFTWEATDLDAAAEFWLRLYETSAREHAFSAPPPPPFMSDCGALTDNQHRRFATICVVGC